MHTSIVICTSAGGLSIDLISTTSDLFSALRLFMAASSAGSASSSSACADLASVLVSAATSATLPTPYFEICTLGDYVCDILPWHALHPVLDILDLTSIPTLHTHTIQKTACSGNPTRCAEIKLQGKPRQGCAEHEAGTICDKVSAPSIRRI